METFGWFETASYGWKDSHVIPHPDRFRGVTTTVTGIIWSFSFLTTFLSDLTRQDAPTVCDRLSSLLLSNTKFEPTWNQAKYWTLLQRPKSMLLFPKCLLSSLYNWISSMCYVSVQMVKPMLKAAWYPSFVGKIQQIHLHLKFGIGRKAYSFYGYMYNFFFEVFSSYQIISNHSRRTFIDLCPGLWF